MEIIGLFGGTFNPIHNGHLALALSVLNTLNCSHIRFLPAAIPPHKAIPAVTAQHRANMVQLAIADHPEFILDTCELDRQGPSYTIETLHLLRNRLPDQALCLIIGQDSYLKLPSWHRWLELLDYCHLLVVHRADTEHKLQLHAEHENRLVDIANAAERFAENTHGFISYLPVTPPDISSTRIREALAHAEIASIPGIPEKVLHYIKANHLYQS
ncbi:nicotinate-nucleotide adenylyltransferase [Methylophilus flavus]|uniref:Probable nicotinate-nucleotide adenylyltransferase n=1 Tax=Methylophilus flavus TaxID=640084 RepID=A0ABW3PBP4_9PROT